MHDVYIIYLVWALWETENFDFFGFSIFPFYEDIHYEPKMVKVSMRPLYKITIDQKEVNFRCKEGALQRSLYTQCMHTGKAGI